MNPLVLVHGFMGGGSQWKQQDPLRQNRPLVALDLPGFGARADEAPLPSIAEHGAWVLQELSRLGHGRFDLMGHSMGGMIAQEITRQAPDRVDRLVLYATGPKGTLPGRFEPIETSIERARTEGPRATARQISATWFLETEAAPEYAACAAIAERSRLPAIIAGLRAMQGWNGEGALAGFTCPTLVLWGDRDRTYPWPQIHALWQGIAGSQLAVVPGCAHAVHLEWPSLFNTLVDRFLSR